MSKYSILKDIWNFLIRKWRTRLSNQERHILHSALKSDHQIYHIDVDQIPSGWIRIGNEDFLFRNDPEKTKSYLEALDKLIEKGFVEHTSGQLYELTLSGCKKARKIKTIKKL